jgi:hypothetical protein
VVSKSSTLLLARARRARAEAAFRDRGTWPRIEDFSKRRSGRLGEIEGIEGVNRLEGIKRGFLAAAGGHGNFAVFGGELEHEVPLDGFTLGDVHGDGLLGHRAVDVSFKLVGAGGNILENVAAFGGTDRGTP